MFSVIIPLYNKADYIAKSISSVLNQTFTDFELIIVDDGSTDNSLEIVESFNDERIKIFTQKNSGVSVARNNGVKNAKYDYIAFLDADDWWNDSFLQEMNLLIQESPDAVLYGSNYKLVTNGKEISKINITNFENGYINYFELFLLNKESPIWTSAVCIKKYCFLQEKGFKPNLKCGEDQEFWMRIACKYKIAYINKFLAFYNQDIDIQNRAITKIFHKENYYIFHLYDIEPFEKDNNLLKALLDFLKIRRLKQYHIIGMYKDELNEILNGVDRINYPLSLRLFYIVPPYILRILKKIKNFRF
jgi:glycosyltransferase involved in cell wall biosynthesis